MKVNTDAKKIEELLTRGVEAVYPTREFLEKALKSGKQLTLYCGFDPTAPTLHIGNGIQMLKLSQFQELGHKVIFLIGDFTGMIGDPTDKTAVRQKLTTEQVKENSRNYKAQASTILDFGGENPAEIKYNSTWNNKLSFEDVLELSSHFTVQRMLERDMFEKRMTEQKPIYLHEFMYPLVQGYDSVAMDVDGEIGGNDQTFNMLAGRDLMKDLKKKEKFVLTTKLLADESGKKMGKSEGNMIAFADTPEDMFGRVMRWGDGIIMNGFELCTKVPTEEIKELKTELKKGVNPRDLKLRLAFEITKTFLGEVAAKKGQDHFSSVIQDKEKPADILEIKPTAYDLLTVLVESGLSLSKSDARRAVEQGGVKIDDVKVESIDAKVKKGNVIQKGKRFFVKVK
ncbi:MAG: tyrosine--tRNA ligase [Patescibacteria group bacterium]|jgi:tyrosyl-tRNA synthetase